MGKMSELAAELAELKRCGEVLISISETLTEMFSGTDAEAAAEPKAEEKPAKKVEKKQKAKEVTLAEVRAVLADKSRQGHTAEVKELLAKYGADKLSEVDASKYAELKAEAEVPLPWRWQMRYGCWSIPFIPSCPRRALPPFSGKTAKRQRKQQQ